MLTINNSVEWQTVRAKLEAQVSSLDYNPQYYQLLANLDAMVSDLSRREVEARRLHRPELVSADLQRINEAIAFFEKNVLFNRLAF